MTARSATGPTEGTAWGAVVDTVGSGDDTSVPLPRPHNEPLYGRDYADVEVPEPEGPTMSLANAHAVFTRWLGADYDLDAIDAVLAAAAVERLDGDPLWLLIVSGSGNAKTETVQALAGIGAHVTSTVSSPGALLSATSQKERAKDATGGLLRQIGDRGVLVIKDVTSILSMNREMRGEVLAAFREVYDGRWTRNVGTDGGRAMDWAGRIVVVGAVTTAWDSAHSVIAQMGDRFVLLRIDSHLGRESAARRTLGNTGSEVQMRDELAAAIAGVIAGIGTTPVRTTTDEDDRLIAAADLVTLARTAVDFDYRGHVVDAMAPEMPTRFVRQLQQLIRGGVAIGMERTDALRLAIRCARDSMPPLRLLIVDDVAAHPGATTAEVRKRVDKPRATVDRQLQALHMLGVLTCVEQEIMHGGSPGTLWSYRLADGIDPAALRVSARNVSTHHRAHARDACAHLTASPTDISGTDIRGLNRADAPTSARYGRLSPDLSQTASTRSGATMTNARAAEQ
ncbi:hypothetical protein [Terrabacter sp. RAF57]|uniref:hypothetical protein n=1 Tax=Terrabacter sp. RAF57 TaxID=3233063 RepID=UPI003F9E8FD2